MRWKTKEKSDWNTWFAWHPVCIEDKWESLGGNRYVWLERVERKEYESYGGGGYDYRAWRGHS
jgi:hypothetical protein